MQGSFKTNLTEEDKKDICHIDGKNSFDYKLIKTNEPIEGKAFNAQ